MDAERFHQIEELYNAALACESKERLDLLKRADPELKREVELLLAQEGSMFEHPAWEALPETVATPFAAGVPATYEGGNRVVNLASLPGIVLDGKYQIERQLGKGGMGAVFLAIHLGTTRTVALKVIVPRLAGQDEFLFRFHREAQAAGRLRHPNVVNVTDFGSTFVDHAPLAYLVMEYLDGENLSAFLKKDLRPAADEILNIVDQVALALDAAHTNGIVHRDLKPDNIWLQPDHRGGFNVKVLDFGIAKLHNPASISFEPLMGSAAGTRVPDSAALGMGETTFGLVLGTPAYMAPEQCIGANVEAPADIYSLSVIAYQMFCGRLPFEAQSLRELLQKQIEEAPRPPEEVDRGISRRISETILSGLAKDPAARPPTAMAFAAQMRASSEGELKPLADGKVVASNHGNCFFPLLVACFALYIPVTGGLYLSARVISSHVNVPLDVQIAVFQLLLFAVLFFLSQMYKAGSSLLLTDAAAAGHFQRHWRPQFVQLVRSLRPLVATHLLNTFDFRPRSFLSGQLWPVVWASEGLSGKAALSRAARLVSAEPAAAAAVAARQWAILSICTLLVPAMNAVGGFLGTYSQILTRRGALVASFAILYPMILSLLIFRFFGPASFFLYLSARRCLGETVEFRQPSARRERRSRRASGVRPATVVWLSLPVLMLTGLLYKRTPDGDSRFDLAYAASDGRRNAVLRKLDSGWSVNSSDLRGQTLLMDAVAAGDLPFARELVARRANVNAQNSDGNTALLLALVSRRSAEAEMLIANGASVDIQNEAGRTAIFPAAMHGDAPMCKLLLAHGADRAHRDAGGKTALQYAEEEGQSEVVAVLR